MGRPGRAARHAEIQPKPPDVLGLASGRPAAQAGRTGIGVPRTSRSIGTRTSTVRASRLLSARHFAEPMGCGWLLLSPQRRAARSPKAPRAGFQVHIQAIIAPKSTSAKAFGMVTAYSILRSFDLYG